MFTKSPIIYMVRKGWHYAGPQRNLMLVYTALFAVSQSIALAEPFVVGKLLNCVQINITTGHSLHQFLHDTYLWLGAFFAIQLGFWSFHAPGRLLERFVQFHIKTNFKGSTFKLLTELPMQWHKGHHSGDSIDKINRATVSLQMFYEMTFQISYMALRSVGTLIILYCFMPIAGIVALCTTLTAIGIVFAFDRILEKQYAELNLLDNRTASAVHDYITNIVSVITLRLENPVFLEVQSRMMKPFSLFKRNIVINELKWFSTAMLIALMIVSVLLWYLHSTVGAGKMIMSGTFFTLFEYLRRIGDSFYNFASIYGSVVRQAADVRSADPLIKAHESVSTDGIDATLPSNWKHIEVRNLNFTYEDEKHRTHHLENISLDLTRGKTIAFVGESGSGKSTLLNLLRGMQVADQAEVSCDGNVLPHKLAHLAHRTTLMPQDPEIFADTILFNITFGFESDNLEVTNACKLSRLENVLARLPEGLQTNIAEKGVNLSGGEKQRLAFARGVFFANDSDIVLMDEPTSSVDTANERQMYEDALKLFRDKCVISAIHKLHLLEMFDEVYVFSDGCLVERGTFSTLIERSGSFAKLWRHYQTTESAS